MKPKEKEVFQDMKLTPACRVWLKDFGIVEPELTVEAKSLSKHLAACVYHHDGRKVYMREYMRLRRLETKITGTAPPPPANPRPRGNPNWIKKPVSQTPPKHAKG